MKSQNDMIFSIVAIVLALIFGAVFFFTKREPVKPQDPRPVPLSKPQFAPGTVVMANSLPGASSTPGSQASGPSQNAGGGEQMSGGVPGRPTGKNGGKGGVANF